MLVGYARELRGSQDDEDTRAREYRVVHSLWVGPAEQSHRPGGASYVLASADNADRIVAVAVPGGRRRTILSRRGTSLPEFLEEPSWAPDGRSFALIVGNQAAEEGRVVVVDLASGRRTTLRGPHLRAPSGGIEFSPDGRYLVVASDRADGLYAYDLRRRRAIRVLAARAGSVVSWSPDGRRIAFAGRGVGVIDLRTRSVKFLTEDGDDPAWSPDGTRIAFATDREGTGRRCSEDACYPSREIDVVDADGGDRRRLTRTNADESKPSWAPDGSVLVAEVAVGHCADERSGLVTLRPDGSCYQMLVPPERGRLSLGSNAWRPVRTSPATQLSCKASMRE